MTSSWGRWAKLAGVLVLLAAGCYSRVPAREGTETTWFPFISGEGGQTDLWAIAVPGGQYRRLTNDIFAEAAPTMMADGRVVYSSSEAGRWQLMVVDPRPAAAVGALPRPLYPGGQGDDFAAMASPSGQVVFVSNRAGRKQIFAITPGVSTPTLLTPQPGEHDNPAPGPDGSIHFVSSSPWKRDPGTRQIWRMEGDGSNPQQLTDIPYTMTDLALLPADKLPPPARLDQALLMPSPAPGQPFAQVLRPSVLYVARRPVRGANLLAKGADLDVYRMDTGTKRQLNLTQRSGDDQSPVVMPTGLIAFTTDRRGKSEIWTMDGWGGEQRPWIQGATWVRTR